MGDKGEGGLKNLIKMGDIVYGRPLVEKILLFKKMYFLYLQVTHQY